MTVKLSTIVQRHEELRTHPQYGLSPLDSADWDQDELYYQVAHRVGLAGVEATYIALDGDTYIQVYMQAEPCVLLGAKAERAAADTVQWVTSQTGRRPKGLLRFVAALKRAQA